MLNSNKTLQNFSIVMGRVLFKNFFPLYNVLYRLFKKRNDKEEIYFLKKTVKKGDIVIDIGANIGFYSEILSKLVGETGKVYSFEPDKVNFRHFLENTAGLNNISPLNMAVADRPQSLKLYTSKVLNIDHRTYKVDDYHEEINIEAESIDAFVGNRFMVNFIKMDIQGFEVSALKGMERTIEANSDIKLSVELWPYGLHKAGYSCHELIGLAKLYNLEVYEFRTKHELKKMGKERIEEIEYAGREYLMNILMVHEPFHNGSNTNSKK